MSTRAVYTFIDAFDKFHIYKHCDGYPSGAAEAIAAALPHCRTAARIDAASIRA